MSQTPPTPGQSANTRTAGVDLSATQAVRVLSMVRLAFAVILGTLLWLAPFIAGITVLLPARIQAVAPDDKVGAIAVISIAGSVAALVANILFGALSDRTRSRLGRRVPWMIVGSVACALTLFALAFVGDLTLIVVLWCVFQFFLNAIVAPLLAVIPDRVPERIRGTFSAIYESA